MVRKATTIPSLPGFGNKLFTGLVNFIFKGNYTDVLVGYRGYKKSAIEKMKLYNSTNEHWLRKRFFNMNSWELGASIRAAMLGLKVTELSGSEPPRIAVKVNFLSSKMVLVLSCKLCMITFILNVSTLKI